MMAASSETPALTWRNWLNLGSYVFNFAITYLSLTGIFGPTNTVLSKKYQTLVTPAGWAFSIWGLIFVWETVFVVCQMLPRFRDSHVPKAVAASWAFANGCQCLWTFAFAQEQLVLALVFMLCILFGLGLSAYVADRGEYSNLEYMLLRAPISLHLGWIICASAVNLNTVLDGEKAEPTTLLAFAVVSFAAIAAVATYYAIGARKPDCFPSLVAAWALRAVASELKSGKNINDPTRFNPYQWEELELHSLQMAALILSVSCLCLSLVAVLLRVVYRAKARSLGNDNSLTMQLA